LYIFICYFLLEIQTFWLKYGIIVIVSSGAVIGIALLVVIGVCIRYCVTKQALVKIQEVSSSFIIQ